MNMRKAIFAALRGDPEIKPKVAATLRQRVDQSDGPVSTVVQAAEALEPILAEAVRKRPSKLGKLGFRSAHLIASLASEDDSSNRKLAKIARGSTVGIVFVDVADFTRFTEQQGDDAARSLLTRLHQIVERKIRATGGECVKHLGDGFLLAFPSASQAVRGAVQLSDAVSRERVRDATFDASLRIAVHAGEPLIEGDDLLGHDVNLTARLLDHCRPNEVIVSEAARVLAAKRLRSVTFNSPRRVKIRGLSGTSLVHTAALRRE